MPMYDTLDADRYSIDKLLRQPMTDITQTQSTRPSPVEAAKRADTIDRDAERRFYLSALTMNLVLARLSLDGRPLLVADDMRAHAVALAAIERIPKVADTSQTAVENVQPMQPAPALRALVDALGESQAAG